MKRSITTLLLLSAVLSPAAAQTKSAAFAPLTNLFPPNAQVDEYSATGDGNRVYYSTLSGEVWLFDRRRGTSSRISEGGDIWDVTVARDGSAVAYTKSGENNKDEFIWVVPLDRATGQAAGPQRRISMIPGDVPSISPDGRFVAFGRDDDSTGKQSLVIVPLPGGPERVLGSFPVGIGLIQWTPDAKTLYFELNSPRADRTIPGSIQRITVAGGVPRMIVRAQDGWTGLSPDGKYMAFRDTGFMKAHVVADTNGRRVGGFAPPAGKDVDIWLDNTTIVAARITRPWRLHAYNLQDGSSRVLGDTLDRVVGPVWSPDGKRIAFATWHGPRSGMAIVDAGTLNGRVFPLQQNIDNGAPWSPDGRWALYRNFDRPFNPFTAVDVVTGKQIQLPGSRGENLAATGSAWLSDSRGLLVWPNLGPPSSGPFVVREVGLDGSSRVVRELSPSEGRRFAWPLDDKTLIVMRGFEQPVTREPLSGGGTPVQILPAPNGFLTPPIASSNGKWVAFRKNTETPDNMRMNVIEAARTDGSDHKTIKLPFFAAPGHAMEFVSDRQLVVGENARGKQLGGVYLVTIATGDVRKLLDLHPIGNRMPELALSPDEKTLLYVSRDSVPPSYAALDIRRVLNAKP